MITQNKIKKPSPDCPKRRNKFSIDAEELSASIVIVMLLAITCIVLFRNHQLSQRASAYEFLMKQPILEQRDNEILILKKKNEMLEKELEYYILTEDNHYVDETVSE